MSKTITRCPWPSDDALMIKYHDTEWGVPVHNDRKLFEYLVLDAAQAGLSWRTILYKRAGYKQAFANFNPNAVARFTSADMQRLMKNKNIIRHKLKIQSVITNASAFLKIQTEFGSFNKYLWQFVNHKTIQHHCRTTKNIPITTRESDALSHDLKQRGFKFVGSITTYAFMKAVGLVNDHLVKCFRYKLL